MTIQVEIVSAEHKIFSGKASMVVATTILGEIGIAPGHAPLLAKLKPGQIRLTLEDNNEQVFYISSGYIEIQPKVVTVLADTAMRAKDIDEAAALEAEHRAKQILTDKTSDFEYAKARAELAQAAAQLRALQRLRERI